MEDLVAGAVQRLAVDRRAVATKDSLSGNILMLTKANDLLATRLARASDKQAASECVASSVQERLSLSEKQVGSCVTCFIDSMSVLRIWHGTTQQCVMGYPFPITAAFAQVEEQRQRIQHLQRVLHDKDSLLLEEHARRAAISVDVPPLQEELSKTKATMKDLQDRLSILTTDHERVTSGMEDTKRNFALMRAHVEGQRRLVEGAAVAQAAAEGALLECRAVHQVL
jgi:hypothetical protein